MIILRVGMPQLWCLPIHSADQTSHHGPSRLLDLRQPKVGNLRLPLGSDENVGGLAVTVDDGRLACVQILQTTSDVEHYAELQKMRKERNARECHVPRDKVWEGQRFECNRTSHRWSTTR